MTTFREADHPRGQPSHGGQFTEKPRAQASAEAGTVLRDQARLPSQESTNEQLTLLSQVLEEAGSVATDRVLTLRHTPLDLGDWTQIDFRNARVAARRCGLYDAEDCLALHGQRLFPNG